MTTIQPAVATPPRPPLRLDLIDTSPFNPRQEFTGIEELAASIKEVGLQSGLKLRPSKKPGRFELVFGERRLRALRHLKAEVVTNYDVVTMDDAEVRAVQIVENLQREGVTPLEEADGLARLQDTDPKKWTAAAIGRAIGKTDSFVIQRLKIARGLAAKFKKMLVAGKLSIEVARALAGFPLNVQNEVPDWCLQHGPDEVRRRLFDICIPESAAKFDLALYKGEWLENGTRRYFDDVAQFTKLQRVAAEKKLAEVQAEWPKAQIIDAEDALKWQWADDAYSTHGGVAAGHNRRDGDRPKRWHVPREKCTAIVWIAANGDIRKALGVCSDKAIHEQNKKPGALRSASVSRSRGPAKEPKEHKASRNKFNAGVAAAAAKRKDMPARLLLLHLATSFDASAPDIKRALPKAIVAIKGYGPEHALKIWRATEKLTAAQVLSATEKAALALLPLWGEWHWRNKPDTLVAIAQALGVPAPAIALPEPPKPVAAKGAGKKLGAGYKPAKNPPGKKAASKKKHA